MRTLACTSLIACLAYITAFPFVATFECGRKQHVIQKRIVGGPLVSSTAEWPWLAAFNGQMTCSASIISPKYVLTAAHCVDNNGGKAEVSEMFAIVGAEDIFNGTLLNVSNAYVHPDWNVTEIGGLTTRLVNDIAIVELDEPLVFTEKIQAICLLGDFVEAECDEAHIAGYGGHEVIDANGTATIEYDHLLRVTTVEFQAFENCHKTNLDENNNLADIIVEPHDVVCVGAKGRGPWQGDSGGPLMVAQDGVWFEVGLFSWGTGKRIMEQDACAASYTRITSYCAWIAEVTKGEVKCQSAADVDCECDECEC